jgi:hypothetical protein
MRDLAKWWGSTPCDLLSNPIVTERIQCGWAEMPSGCRDRLSKPSLRIARYSTLTTVAILRMSGGCCADLHWDEATGWRVTFCTSKVSFSLEAASGGPWHQVGERDDWLGNRREESSCFFILLRSVDRPSVLSVGWLRNNCYWGERMSLEFGSDTNTL